MDDNLNTLLNLLLNEETALKFEFYSLNGDIALYTKTVQVSYAISKNLAKFSLNAYDITASIDSTALIFNADGLTVNNGGFVINRDSEYIITKDSVLEVGKIYYELIDGTYIQTTDTSFNTGKIYYEYYPKITLLEYNEDSRTLSIQGSGTFTGNVYAENGIFRGTVYATDGEFTGIIKANSGTIGGFIINENSIVSAGYKETEDSDYIPGKVYYELIDEEYVITTDTVFEEGKTYYEYTSNGSIELINEEDNYPLVGRKDIIDRTIQVLCRRTKNNPIHIGEPGVGKTAITMGLAKLIKEGNVPDKLKNAEIFSLDIGTILAGTKYRGDFEERIKQILDEIKTYENPIVYIDEIHNIVGAGALNGSSLDGGSLIKGYLLEGKIRFIGATTYDDYKKHFEKDKALVRRFQVIEVKETSIDETINILEGIKESCR